MSRFLGGSRLASFWLLAVLLLVSCARRPQVTPLALDAVVLAFGDSLTFGVGADADQSYPSVLEKLIGRRVIREGVPGEVTQEGLARLPEVLDRVQPRLVILCEGGNDLLRKLDEHQVADNVRAMVRLIRERGTDVVLVGVPQPGILIAPPPFYREIAEELHVPYEGRVLAKIEKADDLKADAIHPNAAGYRLLAEELALLLRRSGAL